MDAYTNVETMHFKLDNEKSKIPLVYTYIEQIGIQAFRFLFLPSIR